MPYRRFTVSHGATEKLLIPLSNAIDWPICIVWDSRVHIVGWRNQSHRDALVSGVEVYRYWGVHFQDGVPALDDFCFDGISVIGSDLGWIDIDLEIHGPASDIRDLSFPKRDVLPLRIGDVDDSCDEHRTGLYEVAISRVRAAEDRSSKSLRAAEELHRDVDQSRIAVVLDEQVRAALRVDTSSQFVGNIIRSAVYHADLVPIDGDDDVLGFNSRLLSDRTWHHVAYQNTGRGISGVDPELEVGRGLLTGR